MRSFMARPRGLRYSDKLNYEGSGRKAQWQHLHPVAKTATRTGHPQLIDLSKSVFERRLDEPTLSLRNWERQGWGNRSLQFSSKNSFGIDDFEDAAAAGEDGPLLIDDFGCVGQATSAFMELAGFDVQKLV